MRVLLTNDDGVGAPGNVVLAQALLDEGHEVQVIGPLGDRSGSGTAIGTIEHGADVTLQEIPLGTSPGVTGIALDAPPALAVLTALGGVFGPRPDIVVSGINPGHNVGKSVIFSGTVGAALAATTLGIPSFAVSCGFPPHHRFDTAAAAAVRTLRWFDGAGMPRICANVNVPDIDLDDVRGARSTHFSSGGMFILEMRRDSDRLVLTRGDPRIATPRDPISRPFARASSRSASSSPWTSIRVRRPTPSVRGWRWRWRWHPRSPTAGRVFFDDEHERPGQARGRAWRSTTSPTASTWPRAQ